MERHLKKEDYKTLRSAIIDDWKTSGSNSVELAARHHIGERTVRKWITKERKREDAVITRFQNTPQKNLFGRKKIVITSCRNDADIDEDFYLALKRYCVRNNAELAILPEYYKVTKDSKWLADESDMYWDDFSIHKRLNVVSSMRINPLSVNPLAGKDAASKGHSLIIANNQTAGHALPTLEDYPAILMTTGSINKAKSYPNTFAGNRARDNHSLAALIVEIDENDTFHMRILNCDDNKGFYDIDWYYTAEDVIPAGRALALILGDEHVAVRDKLVSDVTFFNEDSIVKTLKPMQLIRHDSFDCQFQNHHIKDDFLYRFGLHKFGKNSGLRELNEMAQYHSDTTPEDTINVFVDSNHNNHLVKWIKETDPRQDLENLELWCKLTLSMTENVIDGPAGPIFPNLLETWYKASKYQKPLKGAVFTSSRNSYKVAGIECALHGDKASNGAKGSPAGFAKLPVKTITGHSHSWRIMHGAYIVGHSAEKNQNYTGGASSWMHCHCVIYPNGKRQMLFIVDGKWRA